MPRNLSLNASTAALAIASLCLVAACGRGGGGKATAGGPAAPAAAPTSGPDQVIDVSQLPRLRSGLWQMTLDDGDGKPTTSTSCMSGQTPAMKAPKDCPQLSIKRTFLGALTMDMKCATPSYTMVMHTVATGDFQSKMSSDTTMTMTMKGQPAPHTVKMHADAHYIGPCAPGQKPDDAPDNPTAP